MNEIKMKTEVLLVEERALLCVEVSRTIAVEVAVGYRGPHLIRRCLAEGELDFGPFTSLYSPAAGTERLKTLSVRVVGRTDEPADIPLAKESEVGA
jgi:hypothetical protein